MITRSLLNGAGFLLGSVVDVVYPETCAGCGIASHQAQWRGKGSSARGLRPWDRTHLCGQCWLDLQDPCPVDQERSLVDGSSLRLVAAGHTTGLLTEVVGAWKYHGVRGLAWPLGEIMADVLRREMESGGDLGTLLPVPLHRRRRRGRGFNQAALLADLAGRQLGVPVARDVARRIRRTGQQARLEGAAARWGNMAGCFAAGPPPEEGSRRLTLIDDVITSAATTGELALVLRQAGWEVELAASLGLARVDVRSELCGTGSVVPVDTTEAPS
jgi:predicted amidophosphoribosyltransferase